MPLASFVREVRQLSTKTDEGKVTRVKEGLERSIPAHGGEFGLESVFATCFSALAFSAATQENTLELSDCDSLVEIQDVRQQAILQEKPR